RPLTRYFPVTDSNFDLRQYIEMSGHNLDINRDVQVESFRCSGYLQKMGRKWKKWKRRWFVFDRCKRNLSCYTSEFDLQSTTRTAPAPTSAYYFQAIRDVFADHLHMVKSPYPDYTFCVKLTDRGLFLMANSCDVMRIWIDVIFTGAEGFQE
ncbi:hypothetical protein HELRODRAFT_74851, partial [Helobdella robusta]|uniref:PH domain-containing protein n=1 Tax=Helobdella robusta TaxID=6412 RepID=T1G1W5_HELRO